MSVARNYWADTMCSRKNWKDNYELCLTFAHSFYCAPFLACWMQQHFCNYSILLMLVWKQEQNYYLLLFTGTQPHRNRRLIPYLGTFTPNSTQLQPWVSATRSHCGPLKLASFLSLLCNAKSQQCSPTEPRQCRFGGHLCVRIGNYSLFLSRESKEFLQLWHSDITSRNSLKCVVIKYASQCIGADSRL